jgi:hypothetical protein
MVGRATGGAEGVNPEPARRCRHAAARPRHGSLDVALRTRAATRSGRGAGDSPDQSRALAVPAHQGRAKLVKLEPVFPEAEERRRRLPAYAV